MIKNSFKVIVFFHVCLMHMLQGIEPAPEGVSVIKRDVPASEHHGSYCFGAVMASYVQPLDMYRFMQDGCQNLPREFVMSVNKPDEFYTCSKHESLRDKALQEAGEGIQSNLHNMGMMLASQGVIAVPISAAQQLVVSIVCKQTGAASNPIKLAVEVQKLVAAKTVGVFDIEGHTVIIEQQIRSCK